MGNSTTKDKILNAALELFSTNGYDGTSVDAIAEAAGIKGPSLYKHYKGKSDILEAMFKRIDEYYNENFVVFDYQTQQPSFPKTMEELTRMSLKRINFTLHDTTIQKTRKLLVIEQYKSQRFADLANQHCIEGLKQMFTRIFSAMIAEGVLIKENPEMLALEYIAPVSLLIQAYDRDPSKEKEIIKHVKMHLKLFSKIYSKKN